MGGVGPSAPCSVMEKKQSYAFHSWRVGVPLRSLVTEHLSKKQDDSSVFIKPSFNRNLPCALHCSGKFTSPRGVQVAYSWNPFSPPAHGPALLFHVPVYSAAAARATLWAVAGRGPSSHLLLCLQCRASRTNCCLHQWSSRLVAQRNPPGHLKTYRCPGPTLDPLNPWG